MRRIFIGDIQGCREPLERMLEAVEFDPARGDVLHPVGDLVAKGPDSLGVLRLLRDLDARPVLGNHDLAWLRDGRIPDPALASWLAAQPLLRIFPDLIQVHAGLHPAWDEARLMEFAQRRASSEDPDAWYLTTVRYCDEEGRRPASDWPVPDPPFVAWDEHYRGARRVVFGHWARRGLDLTPKVVALDSGCVYGNPLSAWIAEEDRVVQVEGLRSDEGGLPTS
ncbi:MAG: metallophosphoesterase [Planctomycetota bacterium]|nr:metallophosphoesterase [Planctomycetota bacterium]